MYKPNEGGTSFILLDILKFSAGCLFMKRARHPTDDSGGWSYINFPLQERGERLVANHSPFRVRISELKLLGKRQFRNSCSTVSSLEFAKLKEGRTTCVKLKQVAETGIGRRLCKLPSRMTSRESFTAGFLYSRPYGVMYTRSMSKFLARYG